MKRSDGRCDAFHRLLSLVQYHWRLLGHRCRPHVPLSFLLVNFPVSLVDGLVLCLLALMPNGLLLICRFNARSRLNKRHLAGILAAELRRL